MANLLISRVGRRGLERQTLLSHLHSALDPDRFDTILLFLARPVRCRTGYNVTWYVKIMSFPPSFL
ncbi:MAG: hypothetical protein ACLP5H_09660, partial [Desulfomonilaceae bacterium]